MPTRRKNKRKSRKMKGGKLTDNWLKGKFGDLYNNNWLDGEEGDKMDSQWGSATTNMDEESWTGKEVEALNAIMKNMVKHKEKEFSDEYTCDVKKKKVQRYIDMAEARINETPGNKPKDKAAFTWAKEMGEKILAELACATTDATEGGRRRRRRRTKRKSRRKSKRKKSRRKRKKSRRRKRRR
tara:strand:- start:379 stop:927 length:549 start_codon:yes stop_codon:yes gene_type:complete